MSVYRKIVDAVEDAVYIHQYQNVKQITWYVEWWTSINNVNPREIERIINKVTTSYKLVETNKGRR
jgi:hypothetical protein